MDIFTVIKFYEYYESDETERERHFRELNSICKEEMMEERILMRRGQLYKLLDNLTKKLKIVEQDPNCYSTEPSYRVKAKIENAIDIIDRVRIGEDVGLIDVSMLKYILNFTYYSPQELRKKLFLKHG